MVSGTLGAVRLAIHLNHQSAAMAGKIGVIGPNRDLTAKMKRLEWRATKKVPQPRLSRRHPFSQIACAFNIHFTPTRFAWRTTLPTKGEGKKRTAASQSPNAPHNTSLSHRLRTNRPPSPFVARDKKRTTTSRPPIPSQHFLIALPAHQPPSLPLCGEGGEQCEPGGGKPQNRSGF